ncbi:MAG: LCP family protein [Clostridia bacterium]|nr:LCP family protein [Clostridia bacterium]
MNLRRIMLVLNALLSFSLFAAGVYLLLMINAPAPLNHREESSPPFLNDFLDPFIAAKESVNLLLLGGDKFNNNSDTMILINFNPAAAKASMLSIPRDTYICPKGTNGAKINSSYPSGGALKAVQVVSELLNVHIQYYMYLDINAVAKIIDLLDGIDFDIPVEMHYDDPIQNLHIHFDKGPKHLDGKQFVEFMRFRKPNRMTQDVLGYYNGSDMHRIDAQQKMLRAMIEQKTSIRYITKINSIIETVFDNIETNLTVSEALKLSQNLSKLVPAEVNMLKLPGQEEEGGSYFYFTDMDKARKLIEDHFKAVDESKGFSFSEEILDRDLSHSPKSSKKSFINNNPSNGETNIKGQITPKP